MDARGSRLTPAKAQQTAVGVVLPRGRTGEISGSWFMDWRRDNGAPADAPPSFLYVVPVADDRVLVEETCLVGRPPLGYRELRARLQTRLRNRGVRLRGDEPEEHVRFAVEAEPADPARDAGPRRTAPAGHRRPGRDHAPGHRLQRRPVPAAGRRPGRPAGGRRPGRRGRPAPEPTATAGPPAPESGPDHVAPPAPRRRAGLLRGVLPAPPDRQRAYLTGHEQPAGVAGAMAQMAAHPRPPADRGGGRLHPHVAGPPDGAGPATRRRAGRATRTAGWWPW